MTRSNVLVIAPHPDDETLGCGGTLLKHKANGDHLSWVIVTSPLRAEWRDVAETKNKEVNQVGSMYDMLVYRLGFPAAELETCKISDIIESMISVFNTIKPEVVYLPYWGDINNEHKIVFDVAMTILRPDRMAKYNTKKILVYETMSETEAGVYGAFQPNVFVDISEYMIEKIQIMSLYQTEVQDGFGPRSLGAIKALARYRGGAIGVEFAESFCLVREVR